MRRDGNWQAVAAAMQKARAAGLRFDAHIYSGVISAMGRAKKYDLVLQLQQQMHADGVKPAASVYGAMMDACSKNGLAQQTVKLLREMRAIEASHCCH
jgi:pentatricopeptide repeat protein